MSGLQLPREGTETGSAPSLNPLVERDIFGQPLEDIEPRLHEPRLLSRIVLLRPMEPAPGTEVRESSPTSTSGQTPAGASYGCGLCQKTFRRPEHLKRHVKSHTNPTAYVCSTCGKQFARSDVLLRHEYVHSSIDRLDIGTRKQSRACVQCAKARERCSRSEPCSRCSIKALQCQYRRQSKPERRRQATHEDTTTQPGESEDGGLLTPSPYDSSLAQSMGEHVFLEAASQSQTITENSASVAGSQNATTNGVAGVLQRSGSKGSYQTSFVSRVASPNTWRADHQSQLLGLVTPSIAAYPPNAGLGNGPDVNWLPISSDDWNMQWTSILDLGLRSDVPLPTSRTLGPSMLPPTPRALAGNEPIDAATVASTASALPSTPSTRGSNRTVDRGRLYATSSSARATAYEKDNQQEPFISGAHAQVPISKLLQNNTQTHESSIQGLTPQYASDPDIAKAVWQSTYDRILNEYQSFITNAVDDHSQLADEGFLTMKQLDMMVQLFFNRFMPSLPFLHETLAGANEFWVLTLAMATLGCHYTKTEEFDRMVVPLHDFLCSALREEADTQREPATEVLYLQAFLLSQIGLTYYGPTAMRERAMLHHGSLVRRAEGLGLFSASSGHFYATDSASGSRATPVLDTMTRWHTWVKQETARRLGYSIWVLDVMACYHFGSRSLLPAQLPFADLPHDGLWAAPSEHEWSSTLGRTERNPPLASAVRRLFVDREIKPDLGEFSRIIVLHGLYHEIQQVKSYFQRPLSTWIPTAPGSSQSQVHNNPMPLGLSEAETYSAWRNASLDCVDVLHWWANGVIALHSGMEHTTVLHLHMSRIILLVPINEILVLVQSMANRAKGISLDVSAAEVHEAESKVLRWAHRDESKARLTLIHSGVTWWHLRRFSAAAFYEPQSVYLATLTLWAYSYYVSRPAQAADPVPADTDNDSGSESSSEPGFIWLDRPNDDEMVQFFVRKGRPERVRAFVAGVGDIFEPQGPAKILKEGLKIIEKIAFPWGRESEYVRTLQLASQVMTNAQE